MTEEVIRTVSTSKINKVLNTCDKPVCRDPNSIRDTITDILDLSDNLMTAAQQLHLGIEPILADVGPEVTVANKVEAPLPNSMLARELDKLHRNLLDVQHRLIGMLERVRL